MQNVVSIKQKPKKKVKVSESIIFIILCALVVVFLAPIAFIVVNSF